MCGRGFKYEIYISYIKSFFLLLLIFFFLKTTKNIIRRKTKTQQQQKHKQHKHTRKIYKYIIYGRF